MEAWSGRWLSAPPALAGSSPSRSCWWRPGSRAIAWKSGCLHAEAVGHDMLGKVAGAAERHWGPPGAYALVFFATCWPAAAFAASGACPSRGAARREPAVAFLIAAVLPAWLIFEAVADQAAPLRAAADALARDPDRCWR
ncbi:hypothetical protein ACU4GA_29855 [Methylobacterium oryzae CBMB20]